MNHTTPNAPSIHWPLWQRAALWLLAATALAGVFALYLEPDFMLTMANQVWACF